jgi:hypothetical protein
MAAQSLYGLWIENEVIMSPLHRVITRNREVSTEVPAPLDRGAPATAPLSVLKPDAEFDLVITDPP